MVEIEEKENFSDVLKRLAGLKKRGIYVGIPQEERRRDECGTLVYSYERRTPSLDDKRDGRDNG